jgi:hypothetical protein
MSDDELTKIVSQHKGFYDIANFSLDTFLLSTIVVSSMINRDL